MASALSNQVRVTVKPDTAHISTSYFERQNLSIRMGNRQFTRLTKRCCQANDNSSTDPTVSPPQGDIERVGFGAMRSKVRYGSRPKIGCRSESRP